jgi:DNA-binding beta-propeller fold protein YncE
MRRLVALVLLLLSIIWTPICAADDDDAVESSWLPTGTRITPTAAIGALFQPLNPDLKEFPNYTAGQAITALLSPDAATLLILTSGYNVVYDARGKPDPAGSSEYVFVYDVSQRTPSKKQVIALRNTYAGLVFAPDGDHFYVSGGVDDVVHDFARAGGEWRETDAPIPLGHVHGEGIKQKPSAAGIAISGDGSKLVVANVYNDSVSVVDLRSRKVSAELDLRPGKIRAADLGRAGGEYPFWVVAKGNHTAFVSSQRDREIDVIDYATVPHLVRRIKVAGNPNKMTLDAAQERLFVACDNSDTVVVIDADTFGVRESIRTVAPPGITHSQKNFHGAAPNDVALSADQKTLYVTNGGTNALAVIPLVDPAPHRVHALIPTGWYPNAVAVGRKQPMLYVVNGRGLAGANRGYCSDNDFDSAREAHCKGGNQYVLGLEKAGFLSLPVPDERDLDHLTRTAAANNHFDLRDDPRDTAVLSVLHRRIKHVIYIVRENRTYDQILGDLGRGNGDPSLVEFGAALTPNQHAFAKQFVLLDSFYDSGSVSGNGWPWSTAARESDIGVKTIPLQYAKTRGAPYDVEGTNRGVNVSGADVAARRAADPSYPDDPDLLPGTADVAAPDGSNEAGRGYLWDAALRAHLTVRNYGFFLDLARYDSRKHLFPIALERDPAAKHLQVAYSTNAALKNRTDPYFRGFDNRFPDFYREREWEREFDQYAARGDLPSLTLLRLMHDHLGDFGQAIDGVDTPETQVADNDDALGRVVEKVANSRYKDSTLIFVIEDDAQDGPDHVDAHRSVAFIMGPFVKHGAIVSTRYTTVNMLRTIEDVLGIEHLSIYDAYQRPMTDAFDLQQRQWSYVVGHPVALYKTALPMPHDEAAERAAHSLSFAHDAQYWTSATAGYDWSQEDRIDTAEFNRILWSGLFGNERPYPTERSGQDLRPH